MIKLDLTNYNYESKLALLDCFMATQGLLSETCTATCDTCSHEVVCHDIDRVIDIMGRVIKAEEAVEKYVQSVNNWNL